MNKRIQQLKWNLHQYKARQLLILGLKTGSIRPYNMELIEKLRTIYYGGIPASIILLSDAMSNGYCYDRALLLSEAFIDEEDDVQLVYATIDSIRLNPEFMEEDNPMYADHCFVERITKDGKHLIYDTSSGLIYDKKMYWIIENPKLRKINTKKSIINFIEREELYEPKDIERNKYASPLILPSIEMNYEGPYEKYSKIGDNLLKKEIEKYKEFINYDGIKREIEEDMKKMGLRR